MKVNEAENQKKESWLNHQKMYKSYQEIEKNTKTIQSKLKKSIEKARWVVSDLEIIGIDISNIQYFLWNCLTYHVYYYCVLSN